MARTNHSYSIIENEGAYEAAIRDRIRQNRRKTAAAKFASLEDGKQIVKFLNDRVSAEVSDKYFDGRLGGLRDARDMSFIDACWFYMMEAGCPTDGQLDAIRRMIVRNAERRAERAQADAGSQHVGTVGARIELALTIRNVMTFEGMYGTTYIHIMNDAAGNVVVYKGSAILGQREATVTVKATVKEHGERDGVKQTILARPKVIS